MISFYELNFSIKGYFQFIREKYIASTYIASKMHCKNTYIYLYAKIHVDKNQNLIARQNEFIHLHYPFLHPSLSLLHPFPQSLPPSLHPFKTHTPSPPLPSSFLHDFAVHSPHPITHPFLFLSCF